MQNEYISVRHNYVNEYSGLSSYQAHGEQPQQLHWGKSMKRWLRRYFLRRESFQIYDLHKDAMGNWKSYTIILSEYQLIILQSVLFSIRYSKSIRLDNMNKGLICSRLSSR